MKREKRKSHIRYSTLGNYYEIYGIKYSDDLFKDWGEGGLPIGTLFKLDRRENGQIWIKVVEEERDES